jgi:hypothetical protein
VTTPEQNRLEDLLAAAAADPMQVPEFLDTLLDATVIVPGIATSRSVEPGQSVRFEAGQAVQLAPLTGRDGSPVQPFYTSEEALQRTIAAVPGFEQRFLALACRDLWELTRGATLILNPHSQYGKEFLPGEIASLLAGSASLIQRVITTPTNVLVGVPAHIPPGMEDALTAVFRKHPDVERAFLGWKVTPDTGDESYLLVIVAPGNAREQLGPDVSKALVYYSQAHPVDLFFAVPGADHMLSGIEPFYRKGSAASK